MSLAALPAALQTRGCVQYTTMNCWHNELLTAHLSVFCLCTVRLKNTYQYIPIQWIQYRYRYLLSWCSKLCVIYLRQVALRTSDTKVARRYRRTHVYLYSICMLHLVKSCSIFIRVGFATKFLLYPTRHELRVSLVCKTSQHTTATLTCEFYTYWDQIPNHGKKLCTIIFLSIKFTFSARVDVNGRIWGFLAPIVFNWESWFHFSCKSLRSFLRVFAKWNGRKRAEKMRVPIGRFWSHVSNPSTRKFVEAV